MKIVNFLGLNPVGNRPVEKMYSDSIIKEMEAQGYDMSEIKQKKLEAQEKRKAERQKRFDLIKLEKLKPITNTPRTDIQFINATQKINKSLTKFEDQEIVNGKLVLAKVIQANSVLFNPGNYRYMPGVYVAITEGSDTFNEEKLEKIASNIIYHRDNKSAYTGAELLVKMINNSRSNFCLEVPNEISEGTKAWCFTFEVCDQLDLPETRMPINNIIPIILIEEMTTNKKDGPKAALVPAEYYTEK